MVNGKSITINQVWQWIQQGNKNHKPIKMDRTRFCLVVDFAIIKLLLIRQLSTINHPSIRKNAIEPLSTVIHQPLPRFTCISHSQPLSINHCQSILNYDYIPVSTVTAELMIVCHRRWFSITEPFTIGWYHQIISQPFSPYHPRWGPFTVVKWRYLPTYNVWRTHLVVSSPSLIFTIMFTNLSTIVKITICWLFITLNCWPSLVIYYWPLINRHWLPMNG